MVYVGIVILVDCVFVPPRWVQQDISLHHLKLQAGEYYVIPIVALPQLLVKPLPTVVLDAEDVFVCGYRLEIFNDLW